MKNRVFNKKVYKWIGVFFIICLGSIFFIRLLFLPTDKKINQAANKSTLTYRPVYHFSAPDKWINDPQRPVFFDGKYHYYYLYNKDYPNGNGTEWRQATSRDLVHWKDEGVAIPKYTTKNGDPWTGSFVVDDQNTAGFGKGAVVAIVTQPSADGGKQEQYLWYSTDRGKTFKSYSDHSILPNPEEKDFRDPKIIWDSQANKWVMVLAEGTKIGFYESLNLKEWHYTGGFFTQDIGTIECPDLFKIQANDGSYKWVLGASANGKSIGKPNTYAYWIGNYNGKEFFADNSEPKWLDYGFDWYAGVTFQDGKSNKKRYALAWMNNWDYPNSTPTLRDGFNGVDSIVRQIQLKKQDINEYILTSQPIEALNQLTLSTNYFKEIKVNGSKTLKVKGDAFQLDTEVSWSHVKNVGLRIRESTDKQRHIDVGLFVQNNFSYVNRGFTDQPDKTNKYVESKAPFDASKKKVHIKVLVDKTSIEVFIDDGYVTYSSEVFPHSNDNGITLFSDGGTSIFKNVTIKHFRSSYK
ncbi:glycoside hydrolase family 32 protein [Neobacillus pocheonensis]|uniref:Glycoside hydrolase family 32 protein n=1 Tax=Neobacillus pocheonensis TaxID=363869 RepID=A0ABT0WHG4_9BACI|nr:glycoside hydrolase family 32 protein [Neobacillus pocheonensis]